MRQSQPRPKFTVPSRLRPLGPGVLALAALLLTCLLTPAPLRAQSTVEKTWIGSLVSEGQSRRLVFHIDRDRYYRRQATMDSPDDGWMRIPASSVTFSDKQLTLQFAPLQATLVGELEHGGKRLRGEFIWQGQAHAITLKPVSQAPAAAASSYRRQKRIGQWPFVAPGPDTDLDRPRLQRALQRAAELPFLNSLLLIKNGQLLVENYYHGSDAQTLFNVKSVNKSVLSALFGIAQAEGKISPEQSICDQLAEASRAAVDPAHCEIRLRDLLTMQSGLDYREGQAPPGQDPVFDSPNWLQAALALDRAEAPGQRYRYTTPATHILSAALSRAVAADLAEFAQAELFAPMGVGDVEWTRAPEGIRFGGSEMFMSARDMALFGQLYLRDGHWGDRQIVPADWVRASTTNQLNPKQNRMHYGYLWKLSRIGELRAYRAAGVGGQYIINVPDAGLTIVSTANPRYMSGVEDNAAQILALIEQEIVPAVLTGPASP